MPVTCRTATSPAASRPGAAPAAVSSLIAATTPVPVIHGRYVLRCPARHRSAARAKEFPKSSEILLWSRVAGRGPARGSPRSSFTCTPGSSCRRERTALALAELSGVPLSSGTIAALTARATGRLDGFLEHVREQIPAGDVAGFDETGSGWRAGWPGCTVPAPATTPCSRSIRGVRGRRSRRWA